MIVQEFEKLINKWTNKNITRIVEANILAPETTNRYSIKFKNSSIAKNVPGPTGLSTGDPVVVAKYAGNTGLYAILSRGRASGGSIKRIFV